MEEKIPDKNQEKQLLNDADKAFELFDNVVTNAYLKELQGCEIVPFEEQNLAHIRWYRIIKIVIEKDVFFADKLSMLYVALHDTAKNVVLVLKKNDGKIDLYLGSRDFERLNRKLEEEKLFSAEVLKAGLCGYLPGVRYEVNAEGLLPLENKKDDKNKKKADGNKKGDTYISSVSVLASLRDDKKENFVQGLEKLINASEAIPNFTAYFIAENVIDSEATNMIQAFNELQTNLSPMCEVQSTFSESHTEGISESITEGFSETVTKNISKTVTHSNAKSDNYSPLTRTNTWNIGPFSTSIQKLLKNKKSEKENQDKNYDEKRELHHHGEVQGDSLATGGSLGNSQTISNQTLTANSQGDTNGVSLQITQKNSQAKRYVDLIDQQVERLQKGIPFGLWSVATYFVAPLETSVVKLANIYKGCIVGEDSNLSVGAINCWKGDDEVDAILSYLNNQIHPVFDFNGVQVTPGTIVTSEELAVHLSLPQSSVPGILVREEQSFGRNVPEELSEDTSIGFGKILHLGEVSEDNEVRLDIASLNKHVFVTGTTGSGKSNTLYQLISGLNEKGIGFLIIEPAKGEYKHVFGNREDVDVFGSNPKKTQLLHINPFEFPEEIDVYQHIDALVEVFNACWPMYAAMPQVLSHSIIEAYKSCGWEMEHSINRRNQFPTIEDVLDCLKKYINSSEYSQDTKGDYKGSLETRLQSLCDGTVGRIFKGKPISDKVLFNGNVIIDLSEVRSSETNSLIMGLLVLKLNEFRSSENKGMNQPLRHVTVLEEAHNLLKRTSTNQIAESSNVAGMAVEKIANSMAEMRTYGEGFIIADQSPSMLDLSAIRNTNTKIIMALPEKDDRETAGKSVGLDEKHIEEISRLKTGEAIVYQSGWEEAVKAKIEEYITPTQPWKYDSDEPKIKRELDVLYKICQLLVSSYTMIDAEINCQELLDLLIAADIPVGRYNQIKEKLDEEKQVTTDDVAFIFATMIGTEIFDSAKSLSDISLFDAKITRSLSDTLGLANDERMNVYVNMYMKGCSRMSETPFYEGWLESTLKNK